MSRHQKIEMTHRVSIIIDRFFRYIGVKVAGCSTINSPRGLTRRFLARLFSYIRGTIVYYHEEESGKILDIILNVRSRVPILMDNHEAYQLYCLVKATSNVMGSIAEVGTYLGGSALLICTAKSNKKLYLFDTFQGLPKPSSIDGLDFFAEGQYHATQEELERNLKSCKDVYIYPGVFPDTSISVQEVTFSFVHLDVDLYASTLDCLSFFYHRMSKGGVMLSHDYRVHSGVTLAFDEFFLDKQENVIELSGAQCMVVKL